MARLVFAAAPRRLVAGLLAFSVPLGFVMGGLAYGGVEQDLGQSGAAAAVGIAVGLVFGLGLPRTLLSRQRSETLRRVPGASNDEIWRTDHERVAELDLPVEESFDLCLDAIRDIRRMSVSSADRAAGRIRAWTWDTRLSLDLRPGGWRSTSATIRSRERRLQRFDDGKNLANVVRLHELLGSTAPGNGDEPKQQSVASSRW